MILSPALATCLAFESREYATLCRPPEGPRTEGPSTVANDPPTRIPWAAAPLLPKGTPLHSQRDPPPLPKLSRSRPHRPEPQPHVPPDLRMRHRPTRYHPSLQCPLELVEGCPHRRRSQSGDNGECGVPQPITKHGNHSTAGRSGEMRPGWPRSWTCRSPPDAERALLRSEAPIASSKRRCPGGRERSSSERYPPEPGPRDRLGRLAATSHGRLHKGLERPSRCQPSHGIPGPRNRSR